MRYVTYDSLLRRVVRQGGVVRHVLHGGRHALEGPAACCRALHVLREEPSGGLGLLAAAELLGVKGCRKPCGGCPPACTHVLAKGIALGLAGLEVRHALLDEGHAAGCRRKRAQRRSHHSNMPLIVQGVAHQRRARRVHQLAVPDGEHAALSVVEACLQQAGRAGQAGASRLGRPAARSHARQRPEVRGRPPRAAPHARQRRPRARAHSLGARCAHAAPLCGVRVRVGPSMHMARTASRARRLNSGARVQGRLAVLPFFSPPAARQAITLVGCASPPRPAPGHASPR
jgi:hypothetical protein